MTWQTGSPVTAYLGGAASDNGTGASFSLRADQVGDPNVGHLRRFAFVVFQHGRFRDACADGLWQRAARRDRRALQIQLERVAGKSFRFGPQERHHLDVRWEVQNLSNTPSFSGLSTTLGSTSFGRVTAARLDAHDGHHDAVQFLMRNSAAMIANHFCVALILAGELALGQSTQQSGNPPAPAAATANQPAPIAVPAPPAPADQPPPT